MSARRMASSVFCEPLATHRVQPPLIPKRMIAASASTATGINFLNHPLLSNAFPFAGAVAFSGLVFVSFCLAAGVPFLLDGASTGAAACFVSGMLTCPPRELFQTPLSLSRIQAMPADIHGSLQQAMPETEARLTTKRPETCNDLC